MWATARLVPTVETLREILAANPTGISRAGMLAWAQLRIDPTYDETRLDADLSALGDEVVDSDGFYRLSGPVPAAEPSPETATADGPTAPSSDPGGIVGWSPSDANEPEEIAGWASPDAIPAAPDAPPAAPGAPPEAADGATDAMADDGSSGVPGWIGPDGTPAAVAGGEVDGAADGEAARKGGIGGIIRRFWILGIIALIAIGAILFRDRISGSASALAVGDCFDLPGADVSEIEDVQHHPCNEPHEAEVFLVYEYPDATDAYPSDDAFRSSVGETCVPAFNAYTGSDFEQQPDLDIYWLYPLAEGWQEGDRQIVCSLFRVDEQPLDRSMKAAQPA